MYYTNSLAGRKYFLSSGGFSGNSSTEDVEKIADGPVSRIPSIRVART
jgi:hypothetical protein